MIKFLRFILSGFDLKHFYNERWLVNFNTGEIHEIKYLTDNCKWLAMTNKKFMSDYDLDIYKKRHPRANGCYYCNRKNHVD